MAAGAVALLLGACGSGARQDAGEPSGSFAVQVQRASFPLTQRLARQSRMVITVRNADQRTIPDIGVTVTDPKLGTSAEAFGYDIASPSLPELATGSRPLWIVDQGPDLNGCGYSCQQGGPGGGVTAYSNTWALGPLKPGASVTFSWALTAVHAGTHVIQYRIDAGLNGKARAVLSGGGVPGGTFRVSVAGAPRSAYVNGAGQVVTSQ